MAARPDPLPQAQTPGEQVSAALKLQSAQAQNNIPAAPPTPRSYLDNPEAIANLSALYSKAVGTFANPRLNAEHMIAVGQDGKLLGEYMDNQPDHIKANIPTDSVFIVHSHPQSVMPTPSPQDYQTANVHQKPNFVISRTAIYAAMPGTDPNTRSHVKVADISQGKGGKLQINWASQ